MAGQTGHPTDIGATGRTSGVRVLLFEHTLLESARFDQCRNRFSALLYSTVRPGTPAEPSDTVRTPRGGASQDDVVQVILERPRVVLKRP